MDQFTVNCDSSSAERSLKFDHETEYRVSDRSVKSRRFLAFKLHHFEERIDISLQDIKDTVECSG